MLDIILRILALYLIIGLSVLVGIAIASDVLRWLRGLPEQASQDGAEEFGGHQ